LLQPFLQQLGYDELEVTILSSNANTERTVSIIKDNEQNPEMLHTQLSKILKEAQTQLDSTFAVKTCE